MFYAGLFIVLFIIAVWAFMQLPQFGRKPKGEHLEVLRSAPNYSNGAFQNIMHTPPFTNGANFFSVSRKFFFGKSPLVRPPAPIPSVKTDLRTLDRDKDLIVWFGHSSYLLQLSGTRFLIDPVLAGHASPVSTSTLAFPGSDIYRPEDMPDIDVLIITHDHYDHLDHKTVSALRPRVGRVITSMGVGAHLQRWGYRKDTITEGNWGDVVSLPGGFTLTFAPARHFSGRGFKRNGTLWSSIVLQSPLHKLYLGGDSGYGTHFKEIGAQHGPFDLAILENGQYNESWQNIHMMPEEVVQAATELGTRTLFPVHWAKFALSLHAWDDSITRVVAEARRQGMPLIHPRIGQVVLLNETEQHPEWWKEVGASNA